MPLEKRVSPSANPCAVLAFDEMPVNDPCFAELDHDAFVATAVALGAVAEQLQKLLACNDLLLAHGHVSSPPDLGPFLMRAISVLTRSERELLRFAVDAALEASDERNELLHLRTNEKTENDGEGV